MAVKVYITGVLGRMGRAIAQQVLNDKEMELVGCNEIQGHCAIGQDIGSIVGKKNIGVKISGGLELESIPSRSIIIDFTTPQTTKALFEKMQHHDVSVVTGTTGLSNDIIDLIKEVAQTHAVLYSPNMSIGVNFLFYLTQLTTEKLGNEFDIEIIETHHRHKKDSPSGTAKRLAEIICSARNTVYTDVVRDGRSGIVGERTRDEIGMHAVRGGDIVGEHTVLFAGPGERVELRHCAHNRDNFVQGAIKAAKWITAKQAGLYSMRDFLGF